MQRWLMNFRSERDHEEQPAPGRRRRRPLIGSQIRRLRTDRGLTLAQMAEATGLNIGYLSKVETDKASPSLETLATVSDVLDAPMSWLLTESIPPPKVVRHADRQQGEGPGTARIEIVDGSFPTAMRIIEAVLPAGAATRLHAHPGEEHHIVLQGRLRLTQGENVVDIESGDYTLWDGTLPHNVENIGDGVARLLIIRQGPGNPATLDDGERVRDGRGTDGHS